MAAKLWLKLFEPKFNNVCTNTSIFNGLKEQFSSLSPDPGKAFKTFKASSGVHLRLIDTTSSWATFVPGREPNNEIKN